MLDVVGKCDVTAGVPWDDNADPQARHFHAELYDEAGGLVARSATVAVEVRKFEWTFTSIGADPSPALVPGSAWVSATVDRTTAGTGYQLYLVDDDGRFADQQCGQQDSCGGWLSRTWADNADPQP